MLNQYVIQANFPKVEKTNFLIKLKALNKEDIKMLKSNLIEIQRIETATYSNMAYYPGEHFLYF